jgi:hypothetical protein
LWDLGGILYSQTEANLHYPSVQGESFLRGGCIKKSTLLIYVRRVDPDLPPKGKYPIRKAVKALPVGLALEQPLEPETSLEA